MSFSLWHFSHWIFTKEPIDVSEKTIIEQRLQESEEKYRLISENANDLITVQNSNFKIEYVNEEALLRESGFRMEEVLGKRGYSFIHPEDREDFMIKFSELFPFLTSVV